MGFDFLLVQPQAFIEKKKPPLILLGAACFVIYKERNHKTSLI